MKNIIVTGGAGFIGNNLISRLLLLGHKITCLDNFDPFYDPKIKLKNIADFKKNKNFKLIKADITNFDLLQKKIVGDFDAVIHLAAKAGVRPSIQNPSIYCLVNTLGTQNMLQLAHTLGIQKFIFASSSSVYGENPNTPWCEDDFVLKPISPYAATKLSGELLGRVYSDLYGMQFLALRLFTVYGPAQRPDLAIHKFFKQIKSNQPIDVYGDGGTLRDYTYVYDIVSGIEAALDYVTSKYEIINLGNNQPIKLIELISLIEEVASKKAQKNFLPAQPGDVTVTYANIEKARRLLNYRPKTSMKEGLENFHRWLKNYYD